MKNRSIVNFLPLGCVFIVALSLIQSACRSPTGPKPQQVPSAPQDLAISTDVAGNSTLSWTTVSGADSYRVYYSTQEIGVFSETASTTGSSYLLPFYGWYKVSALNEAGEGEKSAGVERVEPITPNGKAEKPMFLNASDDSLVTPGSHDEVLSIKLSLETGGDALYYTTDGTVPEVGNPAFSYSTPISVTSSQTITITAIASGASGYSNSDATVGTFHVRGWETVGNAGFSGGSVAYVSLALDGDENPCVAYRDLSTTEYKATVMRYSGSAWTRMGSTGPSDGDASRTTIAADSEGSIYIGFQDGSASYKATVKKYIGTSWSTLGAAGFSSGTASSLSLAIHDAGSNHTPYLAYQDGANANAPCVNFLSGTSWPILGSSAPSSDPILESSLVVSDDGVAYLAYRYNGTSQTPRVMKFESDAWGSLGEASTDSVEYVSLALDGFGKPYIAFRDNSAAVAGKATVKMYD